MIENGHPIEPINVCEPVDDRDDRLRLKLGVNHSLHGGLRFAVDAAMTLALSA